MAAHFDDTLSDSHAASLRQYYTFGARLAPELGASSLLALAAFLALHQRGRSRTLLYVMRRFVVALDFRCCHFIIFEIARLSREAASQDISAEPSRLAICHFT